MFLFCVFFFFSSRRRHTRCALVTGVQTCALPICLLNWWRYGGEETLKTLAPDARLEDPLDLTAALNESLGPERLAFLQRLVLQRRLVEYLFVHACLHPGRPPDEHHEHDIPWNRDPYPCAHDK